MSVVWGRQHGGLPMTVMKITHLEDCYTIVPNSTLTDNLSWEAIGVLTYLLSKPKNWKVSVAHLVNHSKKCGYPSGRDKIRRILTELVEAGYLMRSDSRNETGKFSGIDYTVLPKKLDEIHETLPEMAPSDLKPPAPDLPAPANPAPANPPLQIKESYKKKKIQIDEQNLPDLFEGLEPEQKLREKHQYPSEFEEFFKTYPKTKGSKWQAFTAWKKLSIKEKQNNFKSLEHYKAYLNQQGWQQPMHPSRYLNQKHHLSYQAPEGVLAISDSVLINGKGFDPKTVIDVCVGFFSSRKWKYDQMLGPAPDHPETNIPVNLISQARERLNGQSAKA